MSDRRVVTKRPEETYRCEECCRSFSQLNYLTRHKREEHGPRVYCRHCNASFPQCRSFQLRIHEDKCLKESYHPRGRVRRERESRGRSQSPRSSLRPKTRSPKRERYSKFSPSGDFTNRSHTTARPQRSPSRGRKPEVRDLRDRIRSNRPSSQTKPSTDPSPEPDDLPASPELLVDFSNNPFTISSEIKEDPFSQPDSMVNLFINFDLETNNATSTLEDINNSSLSEVPLQTISYNIFQPDQSNNFPLNFLLDQTET